MARRKTDARPGLRYFRNESSQRVYLQLNRPVLCNCVETILVCWEPNPIMFPCFHQFPHVVLVSSMLLIHLLSIFYFLRSVDICQFSPSQLYASPSVRSFLVFEISRVEITQEAFSENDINGQSILLPRHNL